MHSRMVAKKTTKLLETWQNGVIGPLLSPYNFVYQGIRAITTYIDNRLITHFF